MPTPLNCANLRNAIAACNNTRYPPAVRLAIQIFRLAPVFTVPSGAGYVYSANYGGVAPTFNPGSGGALAIDSVTRRQFQWNGSTWT